MLLLQLHRAVPDEGVKPEHRFDFSWFNAVAPQLHLAISPADELNLSPLVIACQITRAVESRSSLGTGTVGTGVSVASNGQAGNENPLSVLAHHAFFHTANPCPDVWMGHKGFRCLLWKLYISYGE